MQTHYFLLLHKKTSALVDHTGITTAAWKYPYKDDRQGGGLDTLPHGLPPELRVFGKRRAVRAAVNMPERPYLAIMVGLLRLDATASGTSVAFFGLEHGH
jgi:hypothetical protein